MRNGGWGRWIGFGCPSRSRTCVVLALVGARAVGEEAAHDVDRFDHPVDPRARAVETDTGRLVVGGGPTGADPELQAALRQQIEGRRLLGQHRRVAVVVAPHEGPEAQHLGGVGGGHQRHRRGERIVEVVGHRQRRIAPILDLPGELDPLSPAPPPTSSAHRSGRDAPSPQLTRPPRRVDGPPRPADPAVGAVSTIPVSPRRRRLGA